MDYAAAATLGYIGGNITGAVAAVDAYAAYKRWKAPGQTYQKNRKRMQVTPPNSRGGRKRTRSGPISKKAGAKISKKYKKAIKKAAKKKANKKKSAKKTYKKAQGEVLPAGAGATSFEVNVYGYTKSRKSAGRITYFEQEADRYETSANPSGQQTTFDVAQYGTVAQWVSTTADNNPDNHEALTGFFMMNPNKNITGATDSAGNQIYPQAAAAAQYLNIQDWMNWEGFTDILDITNATNIAQYIDFYWCMAKKDLTTTPRANWQYDQNFGVGLATQPATGTGWTGGAPYREMAHTKPYESYQFNRNWKIIKSMGCELAPNGNCEIRGTFKIHKTISRAKMADLDSRGILYPKGCIALMSVVRSQVVEKRLEGTGAYAAPLYGGTHVIGIRTTKWRFGIVKNRKERQVSSWALCRQPYDVPDADQEHIELGETNDQDITIEL